MADFKDDIINQGKEPQKNIFETEEMGKQFAGSGDENSQEDLPESEEEVGAMNGYDPEADNENSKTPEDNSETDAPKEEQKKEEPKKDEESSSSPHDGKYFVVPKGLAMCDKGSKFPHFKVTSHTKHYWNDEEGNADNLAVTQDDLQFNPPATPFGTCAVKNGNPCAYAPAGKWTKTYEKVKVMGKSCVTELSELMCATGGKISIMKHGQQSEAGKSNVKKADAKEQHVYNPIVDFEEFQEEINGNEGEAW